MNSGNIYKIYNDFEDIYVGSTIEPLNKRWIRHKSKMKKFPERKLYKTILDIGLEKFKIELLEEYLFNEKQELNIREEYYRKLLNANLNTLKCYISAEEAKQYQKQI